MTDEAEVTVPVPTIEPVVEPEVPVEAPGPTPVVEVEHSIERDTRSVVHKLWDEAEIDAEKGLDWFRAEIAKL